MRIQIETRIQKEIVSLQKEAKKMMSRKNFSPFKLAQTISKIRHLRELLDGLATVAVDKLKTLWKEFVKDGK